MSSFTDKLVVTKISKRMWEVARAFEYHVGSEESAEIVSVPQGFQTDFASVPRIFWIIIPPDGEYTQAAVVHDYLYHTKKYDREICDKIFIEAMGVLGVSLWKRKIMHRAVRMFGWIPWKKKDAKEE